MSNRSREGFASYFILPILATKIVVGQGRQRRPQTHRSGDPKLAEALKDIPCWGFDGDADRMVPVLASRDIVKAITWAGGRPRYQEYRGLDHNCWDRASAEAELYRWVQAQSRLEAK
jgi:predicted peptidase